MFASCYSLLRFFGLVHSFSSWQTEQGGIQNISQQQSCRPPLCPHAGPMWAEVENKFHIQEAAEFFSCCLPSCGQKSEKQTGMHEGLVVELGADLSA